MLPQSIPVAYFWSKVESPDRCWPWLGRRNEHGYGTIESDGKRYRASRIAYEMVYGPIPDGLFVCHRCDTPACVRPDHLFLGTQTDNMMDAAQKQRMQFGTRRYNAKLTEEMVIAIRERYARGGISQQALAGEFGVSQGTITHIATRKKWRHVP